MVQASSVFLVASAALYAASPVVGLGLPKTIGTIGKDLVKATESHHSHPAEHNTAAHHNQGHEHEHEQHHEAGKPGSKRLGANAHERKPTDRHTKGAKPGKHELGHEREAHGHQHATSRPGKEHRFGSQEHGHGHESNRNSRPGSQKSRLSGHAHEHEHEHERLGGQRRPGEQGHGHEFSSHSAGREGRLGNERRPEASSHSRPQSHSEGRLGHERVARPESGRPHIGAPSSHLSARPSASRPYNSANQGAIKNEIDSLYRLEGRGWDEEDLFIRSPMEWEDDLYIRDFDDLEDLYIRDFDDVDDLYARGQGKSHHGHKKHGHKKHHGHKKQKAMLAAQQAEAQAAAAPTDPSQAVEQPPTARGWYDDLEDLYARGQGKSHHGHKKHGHKKHHGHKKQKAMLAAQQAEAQASAPADPSQAIEQPPTARGWYDDDLLEFAQRSFYDFYDELD